MSVTALSAPLHRLSSGWTLLASIALYAFFLATIMPQQAADSAVYAGDWGAPDRHFFYTPAALYEHIPAWSEAGRADYIRFRLSWDIGWALAYTLFLVSSTSLALRGGFAEGRWQRGLNLPAVVPGLLDLAENLVGIALVANADTRLDALAWLGAGLTASKWITLVLAHGVLLYAVLAALVATLRRRQLG